MLHYPALWACRPGIGRRSIGGDLAPGLFVYPLWVRWLLFAAFITLVLGVCIRAELQEAAVHNQSQPAQANDTNEQTGQPTANPSSAEHPKVRGQESHWYDSYLNHLTDWLLVLFNGILAIFTVRLFYNAAEQARDTKAAIAVADRSAKAAERNAKTAELALLSVEVPYLYLIVRRHGIIRETLTETGRPRVTGFAFGNNFLTYYFMNFGRTPAEIIEVFSVLQFSMGIPPPIVPPEHPLNPQAGLIVTKNGESENFPCDLTENIFQIYMRGKEFNPDRHIVWFMGYVRYNDVFGNEYIRGFCLGYAPNDDSFYAMGRDGYNYRKKTKSAGEIPDSGQ
jgi:hypothetical protein